MTKVLALDIATETGLAVDGPVDGVPLMVTFSVHGEAGEAYIFKKFAHWLAEQLAFHQPQLVAYEAPLVANNVHSRHDVILRLFGMAAIAQLCAAEAGITSQPHNVGTVKKHFAGSGRADKAAMMARCRQLGWPCRNDHEADAAAIWSLAKSTRDPQWAPRATPLFARGAA